MFHLLIFFIEKLSSRIFRIYNFELKTCPCECNIWKHKRKSKKIIDDSLSSSVRAMRQSNKYHFCSLSLLNESMKLKKTVILVCPLVRLISSLWFFQNNENNCGIGNQALPMLHLIQRLQKLKIKFRMLLIYF